MGPYYGDSLCAVNLIKHEGRQLRHAAVPPCLLLLAGAREFHAFDLSMVCVRCCACKILVRRSIVSSSSLMPYALCRTIVGALRKGAACWTRGTQDYRE